MPVGGWALELTGNAMQVAAANIINVNFIFIVGFRTAHHLQHCLLLSAFCPPSIVHCQPPTSSVPHAIVRATFDFDVANAAQDTIATTRQS